MAYEQHVVPSEEEFNTVEDWGLGGVKAKVKRSSTGWCDFNCLIKRAAAIDRKRKTNVNFNSSLVSGEERKEVGEGDLRAKAEAPAPCLQQISLAVGHLLSLDERQSSKSMCAHYAAELECRKHMKYEVKVQASA